MIVVQLSGGLGNQMFQYALGRALSLTHSCDLRLDCRSYAFDALRVYALNAFDIEPRTDPPSRPPGVRSGVQHALRRVGMKRPTFRRIVEVPHVFDEKVLSATPPLRLEGFWQSERYFKHQEPAIRDDFRPRDPLTAEDSAIEADMLAGDSISVHVRRGDYANHPHAARNFGTLDLSYYDQAVRTIAATTSRPVAYIFSDDPEWCRTQMRLPVESRVVSSPGRSDVHEMRLMTACRAHVIANSSFSWWGAWLDPRPDKTVIAPLRWFALEERTAPDLVPPDWIRL